MGFSRLVQSISGRFFFTVVALCCFFWGQSATAAVTWHKTYSGSGNGGSAILQETSDGGIIAGGPAAAGLGYSDIGVFKLDGEGNIAWQKAYGSMYYENIVSVSQTSDGGYIVGGMTARPGGFIGEVRLVMKLDGQGNIEWQKTFDRGFMFSVRQTRDGGYIVGSRDSFFAAAIKLDSGGNIEWVKSFHNSAYHGVNSIEQTSDGGYIMASGIESLINGVWRQGGWIAKLDTGGNIVWQKTCFDSVNVNRIRSESIQQTRDGGYIVTGSSYSENTGKTASWVARLDPAGGLVWQKFYGEVLYGEHVIPALYEKEDGNFVIALKNKLLTLDQDGNALQGLRTMQGTFRFSPVPTADGGYLGAGTLRPAPGWNADFMIIKLDETGNASLCGSPFMESFQESVRDGSVVVSDSGVTWWTPTRTPQAGDLVLRDTTATAGSFCAEPEISVSPLSLSYGDVELPQSSTLALTISNKGNADLIINNIGITGANAAEFSQTNDCSTVSPGNSCTSLVRFSPASTGTKNAVLAVGSNDPARSVVEVALSGAGIATPNGLLALLDSLVASGQVDPNIAGSLAAKLKGVLEANGTAADGKLQAFINQINAQIGKKITPEAAAILINAAMYIMNNN